MKISYFMALGVFCTVLTSVEVRAEATAQTLEQQHIISAVAVPTYGKCQAGHYASKYLDNIHQGTYCYQCAEGTTWNTKAHTCS